MTIYYLYLKTHNITGLKYLGYTSSKDPHKYKGSGKYWSNHINKYGYYVNTEILVESDSLEQIKEKGIYFSELWNIVDNDEFANLKIESGDGGWCLSQESIEKRNKTKVEKYGSFFPNSSTPEFIKKCIEGRKRNNTLNVQTPETVAKTLETKRRNGTLNNNTPESIAKCLETKRRNGTNGKNNPTPKSIAKQLETKRRNGTLNRTEESIKKQKDTNSKRDCRHSQETKDKMRELLLLRPNIKCPHCGKEGKPSQIKRWHFDNCKKLKEIQEFSDNLPHSLNQY